jgi:hypothetical protein
MPKLTQTLMLQLLLRLETDINELKTLTRYTALLKSKLKDLSYTGSMTYDDIDKFLNKFGYPDWNMWDYREVRKAFSKRLSSYYKNTEICSDAFSTGTSADWE